MSEAVTLYVPGEAVPQGSMKAFVDKSGHAHVTHNKRKGIERFRADLRAAASGAQMIDGPVHVEVEVVLGRPLDHYGTGRNAGRLKPAAPLFHAGRGDLDKYLRAIGDSLTGVVFRDDGQVASIYAVKRYVREGEAPHSAVTVESLAAEEAGASWRSSG